MKEFQKLGVSDVANIINVLNVELPPQKLASHFANYMKKSTPSANGCKLAVSQLETIVRNLTYLNVKVSSFEYSKMASVVHRFTIASNCAIMLQCPVVIAPSVIANFHHYSGLIFQVVLERKNKNRSERDVVAVGGRYDNLILLYR